MQTVDAEIVQAREEMRRWLVKYTNCRLQSGHIRSHMRDFSWPCATCVLAFLTELGLTDDDEHYHEHCAPPDRRNEVWRAIMQIREADLSTREDDVSF